MFMARSINDGDITAMGETIEEVWEELQSGFELMDSQFEDLEWFKVQPIKVTRKLEFVIE